MYIHTLGGCHRWVSMKLKFVNVAYIEKCSVWYSVFSQIQGQLRKQVSTCMHVCGPMILPTIGSEEVGQDHVNRPEFQLACNGM